MAAIIDLIICGLILGLLYALTSEGLWGSALMFFNVVFSGMIAFNFYEPLAKLIDSTGINWGFSDTLCMLGLFCISATLLRMTTETIAPAMVRFPTPVYHIGRFIFGAAGALVTIAIVILAFHAAPVHKKIFNAVAYDSKPPFGLGIDHQWLGFFQYETGAVFTTLNAGQRDPFKTYGRSPSGQPMLVKVFDPRAKWLIEHQDARPYGDEMVLSASEGEAEATTAGATAGAGAAAPAPGGGSPGAVGPGGRRGGRGSAPPPGAGDGPPG
jgi:uncharacterized membrane protein required for colicin V production